MGQIIVLFWKFFQVEENKCTEKEQEWLEKEKAYQEKEMYWQVKEKDWTDERNKYEEREEILKKKLLEDEKQQKEWGKTMQEWLAKAKAYQEKETQWRVKERNWTDERNKYKKREEILKNTLLHDEKQQKEWGKTMQRWLAKAKAYQERETQWQTKEKNWADERKKFEDRKEILTQKLLEYEKQQEEPTEPVLEVAKIDLAKPKQVDQEDPTFSDEAVVEASEIQDSKDSLGEAGVVGSAEPKDNGDSTSTKTSADEAIESKAEVPKPPNTEINSDVEKEAKTTGEASSLLITPQETENIVADSKQTNATVSQNSVADPSQSDICLIDLAKPKQVDQEVPTVIKFSDICCLHVLTKDRTDDNLKSSNNSSSRKERRKNRKRRNGQLHWSQRPELVTVVSKEPQTEPWEAEIKAEDEVCNTDSAMPQLEDHKDPTVIKPADGEGVEVKEAQDLKDSLVEAAAVISSEPKDAAGEAEVEEADTASANPQTDVYVYSTSTTPTEAKRNRRRRNEKKDTGDDTTNLLSRECFF